MEITAGSWPPKARKKVKTLRLSPRLTIYLEIPGFLVSVWSRLTMYEAFWIIFSGFNEPSFVTRLLLVNLSLSLWSMATKYWLNQKTAKIIFNQVRIIHGILLASWKICSLVVNLQSFLVIDGRISLNRKITRRTPREASMPVGTVFNVGPVESVQALVSVSKPTVYIWWPQTRLPRREIQDIARIIDWFPKIIFCVIPDITMLSELVCKLFSMLRLVFRLRSSTVWLRLK